MIFNKVSAQATLDNLIANLKGRVSGYVSPLNKQFTIVLTVTKLGIKIGSTNTFKFTIGNGKIQLISGPTHKKFNDATFATEKECIEIISKYIG